MSNKKEIVKSTEEDKTSLSPFVVMDKVDAFVNAYQPAPNIYCEMIEVFNDARLREYFKAYLIPAYGDPLSEYLNNLRLKGFTMVDYYGEPAILVIPKI